MRVLLVEDNAADARMVREALKDVTSSKFDLVHVSRLDHALGQLESEGFDVVLLDLELPDARGLGALARVRNAVPDVPVVVSSGHGDEALALEAVKNGAQDYLLKDRRDGMILSRSLRYAIERNRAELRIQYLADHDGLTGLPNRRLLLDRLSQALARTQREKKMLALLFLDLNHFKLLNDSLGHAAADELLKGVASRLSGCVRECDTVARLGGDEFTLVLPEATNIEDVDRFAVKVLDVFKIPFRVAGSSQHVSASVGISLYPDDADSAEALLRTADAAMYRAKEQGHDVHQFYSRALASEAAGRLLLGNSLRHAIEEKEFFLHYQPRVSAHNGEIVGMEALLRWQHPTRGLLKPAQFVPLAEEMGLMVPIGHWVLWNACAQGQAWRLSGLASDLQISVNLSAREFSRKDLRRTVERVLDDTRLPPSCLELELTESGIMRDEEATTGTLRELNEMGVRITIDDFGTGYSSLTRLKAFPINALKIDRSFVKDLTKTRCDTAIVTAIITMGHGLELRVIAEGVEEAEQMELLKLQGCDEMQGYYFSAPQPPDRIAGLLANPPEWVNA